MYPSVFCVMSWVPGEDYVQRHELPVSAIEDSQTALRPVRKDVKGKGLVLSHLWEFHVYSMGELRRTFP